MSFQISYLDVLITVAVAIIFSYCHGITPPLTPPSNRIVRLAGAIRWCCPENGGSLSRGHTLCSRGSSEPWQTRFGGVGEAACLRQTTGSASTLGIDAIWPSLPNLSRRSFTTTRSPNPIMRTASLPPTLQRPSPRVLSSAEFSCSLFCAPHAVKIDLSLGSGKAPAGTSADRTSQAGQSWGGFPGRSPGPASDH